MGAERVTREIVGRTPLPFRLRDWAWLLPSTLTVWLINRFGDLFVVLDDGTVHMLDVGSDSRTRGRRDWG